MALYKHRGNSWHQHFWSQKVNGKLG